MASDEKGSEEADQGLRRVGEKLIPVLLSTPVAVLILCLLWIVVSIGSEGIQALNWSLLTSSVLEGGIFESMVGTLYMLGGAVALATPLGVATAVYLVEYAAESRLNHLIIQAVNNLAGVPSIIFGLFGYAFFCRFLGLGVSLLSGWLTLACMILPIIVSGSVEAISMVPTSFREAALALGAPKWRVVKDVVLPAAAPGLATSVILGVGRVAGETAAILFTSSVYLMRGLPSTVLEPVMTLTYHLFVLLVATPGGMTGKPFAMALLLLGLVVSLNVLAYIIRVYYRRRW
ncbi:phosphate ABC transporter permease PstA [Candidatus Bathyarchaeota archaeon]|nr:phosphate ABC transporter permease PstA [Candidatus Bathyarchaeota archaeon]